MPELGVDAGIDRLRHQFAERLRYLRLDPRMRLAEILAARVERTAERTDRAGIGRARGHVLRLESVLAETALDRLKVASSASACGRYSICRRSPTRSAAR